MNPTALFIALGVFIASVVTLAIIGKKNKKYYKVLMANPEQSRDDVYWTFWDRLWLGDWGKLLVFRKKDGKRIWLGSHWIQVIEEE